MSIIDNKKVLLRERKRHTARRVASTHYAALSNPDRVWGGYPIQTWLGGTPGTPQTGMGYPPEMGYPPRPGMGYPLTWDRVPLYLDLGWGTPLPRPGMVYPPPRPEMGYPPPPPRPEMGYFPCGQTHRHVSKHYLPVVLRTRAVIIVFR